MAPNEKEVIYKNIFKGRYGILGRGCIKVWKIQSCFSSCSSNAAGAKEDHRNEKESDLVCLFSLIFRIPPFHFGKSFFFAMLL